jgi:predicted DCC family thiol-disulfide oxidoreductase YuxK
MSLPVARQTARFGYDRFAGLLYAWNRRKAHW